MAVPRALARPTRRTAWTPHFVVRLIEGEHLGLKQLWGGHRPINRRDIDDQLWSLGGVTQLRQHLAPIADAIHRETGDIVARGLLFPRDQLRGIGRLIGVGREYVHRTDELGVGIHTHIQYVPIIIVPVFARPDIGIDNGAHFVFRVGLPIVEHLVRQV
jgi:hypothetical protein